MVKKFDEWNIKKKAIDECSEPPDCHEREIWWCSIGVNVGSEQHSQTSDFSRPVLVVKKFTRDMFWGIPLTTRIKDINFRFRFTLDGVENDLLILQMRSYDRKRLVRKVAVMPKNDFLLLADAIKALLSTTPY
ncbi:MAG: type II toxin-antitoxin system PemK/MazF family toxin [Patescibacteria group bacterium]